MTSTPHPADAGAPAVSDPEPSAVPAFRFQLPPEFHEIPLGIDVDEETLDAQMGAFARAYWGEREDLEPLRALTAALYGVNSRQLAEDGAVHSAFGVFPIGGTADGAQPPERISRCSLLVSVRELANPDPALSAAGIAEMLARGRDGGEAVPVGLPAGPAVVHVAGSRSVWERPEGEVETFAVRIELWMPFPDEDRLLLFCISTTDVQDLYLYQAVLADIADTITFAGDGARDRDQSREDALVMASATTPKAPANPFG
ncbi:hypothetical protein ACFV3R_22135 [Streptomyces sp. NPDC059740]|uniref:hypothetical protein n=1 Tax=Streptomyces sp. NPDC059740 TaxID=3346926 RepID=UPI00365F3B18